jgi:methylated-DNA-[protein]-cysteine S-methyltransferase
MQPRGRSLIYYDEMPSPIGTLVLAATESGLCSIDFGSWKDNEERLRKWSDRYFQGMEWVLNSCKLQPVSEQLHAYFAGSKKPFDMAIDLQGTPFQKRVWEALQKVPYGATASYKEIAAVIGSPNAVRAIGGANNRNPIPIVIPCHRIIGASGELIGYGGGLHVKKHLLQLEGSLHQ